MADAKPVGAVQMELCVGFDGLRPASSHVPVTAILCNHGPDVKGQLVFQQTRPAQNKQWPSRLRRSVAVSLPPGSKQRVQVLAPAIAGEPLTCKLTSQGNLIVERTTTPPSGYPLVVLDSRGVANLPVDLSMTPVAPQAWHLPDSYLGYLGSAGLLVGDMDLCSLSPRQQQAIEDFVLHGGTLIVSCVNNVGSLRAGPVGRLIDLTKSSFRDLRLSLALEQRYRTAPERNLRLPCHILPTEDREGLLWCGGNWIASGRRVGNGKVIWVSFDLWRSRPDRWEFTPALWRDLVSHREFRPSPFRRMMRRLPPRPEVDAYPIAWTGMFMLGYAICVGPGAYCLLKRRAKEIALWLVIPIVTGVFLLFLPLLRHSLDRAKSNLFLGTVVTAVPDRTTATFRSSAILFSRGREQHRLGIRARSAAGVAGHPLAHLGFTYLRQKQASGSLAIEGRIVPACHVRSFAVEGTIELPRPPSTRIVVRPDGLWLRAENPFSGPLKCALAYVGAGVWIPLRDIPAGGGAERNLLPADVTPRQGPGWRLRRESYPDVSHFSSLFALEPARSWLLAQTDLPTPQWQHDSMIDLKRNTQVLLIDVPIDYEHEGRFFVPFGATERTPATRRRAIPQVVEFRLPVRGFGLHAAKLLLKSLQAPRFVGEVEVYNYARGRWIELSGQWQKHPVSKREQVLWRMIGCGGDVYLADVPSPDQCVLWPEGIIVLRHPWSFGSSQQRPLDIQVEGARGK